MCASMKRFYIEEALQLVPRLIEMVDTNRVSPTYGCFDRLYWLNKAKDFPGATNQSGLLAFALVYAHDFPGNIYFGKERMRELSLAGVRFSSKAMHGDGSSDDYYPFERALGAAAFSLYACTEACLVLNHRDSSFERYFEKAGDWLLKDDEPGRISNHQALAACALFNTALITGEERFRRGAETRMSRALSWQDEEGWFMEYGGADPGYTTVTVDYLAKLFKKTGDARLLEPLEKAVDFCRYFLHPDGSYGGEYGSRASFNFYPDGFEILAGLYPTAGLIARGYLEGMARGTHATMRVDKLVGIFAYNYIQAYLDSSAGDVESMSPIEGGGDFSKHFKRCGLYVRRKGEYYLVCSLVKGGVTKVFKGSRNIASDCGLIGCTAGGGIIATSVPGSQPVRVGESVVVRGSFGLVSYECLSTLGLVLFRLVSLLLLAPLPFASYRLKRALQKRLIMHDRRVPVTFTRVIELEKGVSITDTIEITGGDAIEELYAGSDNTAILTEASHPYHSSVLSPWVDLGEYLDTLNSEKTVTIRREIEA